MNTATNNKIPRSNPYEKPISYADREDPIDPIDEPVQTHVDRTIEKLKPMFLTVKLTTFTTICILSFDSSINSFNLNSEQKKKPKQKEKKKKKKNPKSNQTKESIKTRRRGRWRRNGLSPTVGCGLLPTKWGRGSWVLLRWLVVKGGESLEERGDEEVGVERVEEFGLFHGAPQRSIVGAIPRSSSFFFFFQTQQGQKNPKQREEEATGRKKKEN
jgi:hypothetical protein